MTQLTIKQMEYLQRGIQEEITKGIHFYELEKHETLDLVMKFIAATNHNVNGSLDWDIEAMADVLAKLAERWEVYFELGEDVARAQFKAEQYFLQQKLELECARIEHKQLVELNELLAKCDENADARLMEVAE